MKKQEKFIKNSEETLYPDVLMCVMALQTTADYIVTYSFATLYLLDIFPPHPQTFETPLQSFGCIDVDIKRLWNNGIDGQSV